MEHIIYMSGISSRSEYENVDLVKEHKELEAEILNEIKEKKTIMATIKAEDKYYIQKIEEQFNKEHIDYVKILMLKVKQLQTMSNQLLEDNNIPGYIKVEERQQDILSFLWKLNTEIIDGKSDNVKIRSVSLKEIIEKIKIEHSMRVE